MPLVDNLLKAGEPSLDECWAPLIMTQGEVQKTLQLKTTT